MCLQYYPVLESVISAIYSPPIHLIGLAVILVVRNAIHDRTDLFAQTLNSACYSTQPTPYARQDSILILTLLAVNFSTLPNKDNYPSRVRPVAAPYSHI